MLKARKILCESVDAFKQAAGYGNLTAAAIRFVGSEHALTLTRALRCSYFQCVLARQEANLG